jgi:hypothetical protein
MAEWKRDSALNEIEVAAAVPDAVAVVKDGALLGWDESAARGYELEHGLATQSYAAGV